MSFLSFLKDMVRTSANLKGRYNVTRPTPKKKTVTSYAQNPDTYRGVSRTTTISPEQQKKNTDIFLKELRGKDGMAAAAIANIVGKSFNAKEKMMSPEALKTIQSDPKLKSAYNVGGVVGTMAQFAVPYGATAKAISSLPKVVKAGEVIGKTLAKTPLMEKTAMGIGKGIAGSVATDIAVGVPLNTNYALNVQDLKGKEAVKSILTNTGIDFATGGLMEAVPGVYKAIKGIDGAKIPKAEKVAVSVADSTPVKAEPWLDKSLPAEERARLWMERQESLQPKAIPPPPKELPNEIVFPELKVKSTNDAHRKMTGDGQYEIDTVFINPKSVKEGFIHEGVLDHEIGHAVEDIVPDFAYRLSLSKALGETKPTPSGKGVYFDGIYGQTRANEAWAQGFATYLNSPDHLKSNYPAAYEFIDDIVKRIPNLTETRNAVRLKVANDFGLKFPKVEPKVTEVTPDLKAVETPVAKPLTASDLKLDKGEFKVETPEGTQVPKFNNTAYPYLTQETRESVQKELEQGKYLFTNNKLQNLQAKSAKKIESYSPEELDQATKTFIASNDLSPQAQADGLNLALYYQGLGDTAKATEVGMITAERFSEIGSALNTAKLIQKFTPEGRQQMVFNIMNKLQNANSKILKGQKLTIKPETLKAVVDATGETEIDNALRAAQHEIVLQVPVSAYKKMDTLRYITMLGNPKTHIRNIIGNALFVPFIESKNAIGTGLEAVARALGKIDEGTKSITFDKDAYKYAKDYFNKNFKAMFNDSSKYMDNQSPLDVPVFKTKALEKARRGVFGALEVEDKWFFRPAYSKAFARYVKSNKLSISTMTENQIERAKYFALKEAENNTFRDASTVSDLFAKLKKVDQNTKAGGYAKAIGLGGVVPYTKTPVNLVRRGIDYSPIGLVKGVGRLLGKDQDTVLKGLDNIASGLTGTGIMALGAWLYNEGHLDGVLPYDAEGNFNKLQGEQGYAINFGDKSYTIDWAVPIAFPLLSGVEFAKLAEDGGVSFGTAMTALSDLATPITELSLMSGVSDILRSATSRDSAGVIEDVAITAFTGYAGQFIPTVLGQIARQADPIRRTTTSTAADPFNRGIEKFLKKQQAKIPGLSKKLEPYIDEWGRTQTSTKGERFVENFLSPGYLGENNITPVDEEIARLYKQNEDNGLLPKQTSQYTLKFDGSDFRLTPELLTTLKKTKGGNSYKDLTTLIGSEEYKAMTDEEKTSAIGKVYTEASKIGKITTLLEAGKDDWKVWTDDMEGGKADYADVKTSGLTPKEYYYIFKDTELNGKSGTNQYEAYTKLESTELTTDQKAVLWNKYNKAWKNNPYEGGDIPTDTASTSSGSSSGSSGGGSGRGGSSRRSSGSTRTEVGLATKQVNALKTLNLNTSNGFSKAEINAIIKMLS